LFNEEKLKTIFQQNWIVLTRKAQFQRKINNALLIYIKYRRYFQIEPSAALLRSYTFPHLFYV